MFRSFAFIVWLLLSASVVTAQNAPPPPPPCAGDQAPWRDFDFWVGEWDVVHPQTGEVLGRNVITAREGGCLLTENWTGARGGTGFSINFHDPITKAWRQIWQSTAFFIDYSGGLDEEGRMVLEGTIHYHANGRQAPFRGRWTPQPDGTVFQEFWQKDAEGQWQVWFKGVYRRAGAQAPD